MHQGRTTLSKFLIQQLKGSPEQNDLAALLVDIAACVKAISAMTAKGELGGIKEAMEQSMAPGSQTFEQALFKHYMAGTITLDEALANSDSPTNLRWLVDNAIKKDDKPGAAPSSPGAIKPQEDITSIKINLDALG